MKSLIALSMHKAGSSIADLIFTDFCAAKGYEIDRIDQQVPDSPLTEDEIYIGYQEKMRLDGVYYGVARGPYVADMPKLRELKLIVQIRDPRDCITSAFFSYRESHVPPTDPAKFKEWEARRTKFAQLQIDDYAQQAAFDYLNRMRILSRILDGHPDALILKYEDMVDRTEKWLGEVADFIGQPVTDALRATFGDKVHFRVEREDTSRHKRQVRPGDHKRKLRPDTIAHMNTVLSEQLVNYTYAA